MSKEKTLCYRHTYDSLHVCQTNLWVFAIQTSEKITIISEGYSTFKTLSEFLIILICNVNNVGCSISNCTHKFYGLTFGLVEILVKNDKIIYGI